MDIFDLILKKKKKKHNLLHTEGKHHYFKPNVHTPESWRTATAELHY